MKLKSLYIFSALGTALLIGYAVAGGYQMPNTPTELDVPKRTYSDSAVEAPGMILAQAYSTKCATSKGTCTLRRPQEVGTPCECNGKRGRVVR